jgi:HD-GYP domain-containing protein (c-di-GMP phosphodiesterase class II)
MPHTQPVTPEELYRYFPHYLVEFARTLARAVDAKAGYFPGHCDNVAYLVRLMCNEAGMDPEHVARIELAAMLHDTGKLMIPDTVLRKPDRLTDVEYASMKQHPVWSARFASQTEHMGDIALWVMHHHERYDGLGYPAGLVAMEIPAESRLIFVADAFHVMTCPRPYRPKPLSRQDAIDELRRHAGTQFCPDAVEMLAARETTLPKGLLDHPLEGNHGPNQDG